jgi:hypothetical protein
MRTQTGELRLNNGFLCHVGCVLAARITNDRILNWVVSILGDFFTTCLQI